MINMKNFFRINFVVFSFLLLVLCSCEKTTEPEVWDYDKITAYTLEHILLSDTTLIINELEQSTFELIYKGPLKDTPFVRSYNRNNIYDDGNEMLSFQHRDHLVTDDGIRSYGIAWWTKVNLEMNDIEYSKNVIYSFLNLETIPLPANAKLILNDRNYDNADVFFNDACSLIDSNESVALQIDYSSSYNRLYLDYAKEETFENFNSAIEIVY